MCGQIYRQLCNNAQSKLSRASRTSRSLLNFQMVAAKVRSRKMNFPPVRHLLTSGARWKYAGLLVLLAPLTQFFGLFSFPSRWRDGLPCFKMLFLLLSGFTFSYEGLSALLYCVAPKQFYIFTAFFFSTVRCGCFLIYFSFCMCTAALRHSTPRELFLLVPCSGR